MPVTSQPSGAPPGFALSRDGSITTMLNVNLDFKAFPPEWLNVNSIRSLRPKGHYSESFCSSAGGPGTMLRRTIYVFSACPCPPDSKTICDPNGCCDILVPGPWEDTGEACMGKKPGPRVPVGSGSSGEQ
ncbi:hypothetical protein BH11PLA1_BH11PLA1_17640 [soil metagenome]